jgi:DNA topoisomerase VI subunit B
MMSEWEIQEEGALDVDIRHLKMQSAQAIRSVQDALVELITNSDDAYGKMGETEAGVVIRVTRKRRSTPSVIEVRDRAGGMTLEEMKNKILRYGGFDAPLASRGYMGRGAKDIVALGNVVFESVKDGWVSRVEISKDFQKKVMKPARASENHYKDYGIKPGRGGTRVTLELAKAHVPHHDTLCRDLQRQFALRDILQR